MRTEAEIKQRLEEIDAWHIWLKDAEAADPDFTKPLPTPEPIPDYMDASQALSLAGIVRALKWALGGEWEEV